MPVDRDSLPEYVQGWLIRRSLPEIRDLLANRTRSQIIALANLDVPVNERVMGVRRHQERVRGNVDMPTRRRTDELTSTTASRTRDTSRFERISREEYDANPRRFRDPIPVTSSQTGQIVMYVALRGG